MKIFDRLFKSHSEQCKNERKEKIEYLCPQMYMYRVKGRFVPTKRVRTEIIVSMTPIAMDSDFSKFNMYEIKSIEVVNDETASIAQIEYADNLNIDIPDPAFKEDLSCLISKKTGEDDYTVVNNSLASFAAERGIFLSRFCGEQKALDLIWRRISDQEKMMFFISTIHMSLLNRQTYGYADSTFRNVYIGFVERYSKSTTFLKSISHYNGSDLSLNKRQNTKRNAYVIAKAFLEECNI